MNTLTCFPYTKRYYLTHPWRFFRQCWYNLCHAWERATRGYSSLDAFETFSFLLEVIPGLLDEIREADFGYPVNMTNEQWHSILKETSECFRNAIEKDDSFFDEYYKERLKPREEQNEELINSYSEIVEANYIARHESFSKGMKLLEEHFWDLWI